MIGVIVPAHNEAELITACLCHVRRAAAHCGLEGEPVEIVVALDRCTDATASIARRFGATTVSLDHGNVSMARRAAGAVLLDRGARWLASTDADSCVPADWLSAQIGCAADAFCGTVDVLNWNGYAREVRLAFDRLQRCMDGHPHVHGANLGIHADWYRRVGGFAALPVHEDVQLIAALLQAGASIARLAHPRVHTSARRDTRARHGFGDYLKALERPYRAGSSHVALDATPIGGTP